MTETQDIWNLPLPRLRELLAGLPGEDLPEGVERRTVELGGVPCFVFRPRGAPRDRGLLYFHGGGFCLGIFPSNSAFVARIARLTGLEVVLPDYRLAPEHPYPAALHDAVAVCRAALQAVPRTAVIGDSSGCALALSAALVLKEARERLPASFAFLTPMLDPAGEGESLRTRASCDPFRMKDPLALVRIYLVGNDPRDPLVSPLHGDLAGLPPILIHAADHDVFLSDAERLARRASAAGVKVDLKIWDGMAHLFHMQAGAVPQAAQALEELAAFLASEA